MVRRLLPVLVALLSLGAAGLHAQIVELESYVTRGRELAKLGKPDQALPYFLLSLELAEERFGADDPALVPIIDEVAGAQVAGGNYLDAEPLYERALRIQERAAAQYQTGIVRTLNKLGEIYEATERAPEALALYRRVITAWAPVLGGDHPDVKAAGGRLASLALRVPLELSKTETAKTELAKAKPAKAEPAKTEPPAAEMAKPELAKPEATAAQPPPAAVPAPERRVVKLVPMPGKKPPPKPVPKPSRKMVSKPAAKPPPAAAARAPPSPPPSAPTSQPSGDALYAVHLTSIREPRAAPAEWARLRRLYGGLLADLALQVARADLGAKRGIYYRIKGGFLAREAAQARCATFAKRGVWCGVTGPEAGSAAGSVVDEEPELAAPSVASPMVAGPESVATGYRIHLTSIRKPGDAAGEWRRLKRAYGTLLEGLSLAVARADLGPGRGIYYRVQGGELTRQRARALCAAFAARNIWCRVVRPGGGEAAEGPQRLALQKGRRRPVRRRGTRRGRGSLCPPVPWRDRGCRRSPFAEMFA